MPNSTITFNEEARAERERMNAQSGLLKLPAELRNQIYIMVIDIMPGCNTRPDLLPATSLLKLLKTSRQLRKDTLPIIYGQNIRFGGYGGGMTTGISWINLLSTDTLSSLRCLELDVRGPLPCQHDNTRKLAHHLEVHINRDSDGVRYEIECWRMCHGWFGGENECETEWDKCPTAKDFHDRITAVLDRMKARTGGEGFEREDLLAVLKILQDLEIDE